MIFIGSKALSRFNLLCDRTPKDSDIICTVEEADNFVNSLTKINDIIKIKKDEYCYHFRSKTYGFVELFLAKKEENNALMDYYIKYNNDYEYAPLEMLYSLKLSHIHFPTKIEKFEKHVKDLCLLHKAVNGIDVIPEITKKYFIETENRLGKLRTPKLAKTSKDFFEQSKDYVQSVFIHDSIHIAVAHKEKPMYEYMQPDSNSAYCSEKMWNNFTHLEKMQCVLEEAYVIALERKILPLIYGKTNKYITAEDAIRWSLMRICTNLCSGWFRHFATTNYTEIYNMYNKDYVHDFLVKVDQGLVKEATTSLILK